MQDKDNIAQTNKENDEIKETARENTDALNFQQTNSEPPLLEIPAEESVHAQNVEEIPSVEYIGNAEEIPTVELNAQDMPNVENTEFQTAQTVEVQDAPKVEMKSEEQFMFNGYELKTWEFNPRIYKIITGSTIFCILALVAVGQSNVLNTKACDSPLVSKVCQVLDTVYVGSVLLGTNNDWVNEPYERTDLGDFEITYIDTSNISPPLPYPQGYFALANPEMNYNDPMIIPGSDFPAADGFPPATNNFPPATSPNSGFPPVTSPNPISPGKNPITSKANLPKRNPTIKGNPPDTGFTIEGDDNPNGDETRKPGGNQGFPNSGKNDGDKKETAKNNNKQPDIKSDSVDEVQLNKASLHDLGDFVKTKVNENNVNLQTPFVVQATGKLDKTGKIKDGTFKVTKAESQSPDMLAVVKRSIEAIDESGYLKYLKELSGEDLSLLFTQDNEKLAAEIQSKLVSDTRARTIRSGLSFILSLKIKEKNKDILQKTEELKTANQEEKIKLEREIQNTKDDLALLEETTVEANGNKIVIKFNIEKNVIHPLIQRKMLAPRTDDDKPKSNSAAQTENGNLKAGK